MSLFKVLYRRRWSSTTTNQPMSSSTHLISSLSIWYAYTRHTVHHQEIFRGPCRINGLALLANKSTYCEEDVRRMRQQHVRVGPSSLLEEAEEDEGLEEDENATSRIRISIGWIHGNLWRLTVRKLLWRWRRKWGYDHNFGLLRLERSKGCRSWGMIGGPWYVRRGYLPLWVVRAEF